MAGIGVAGKEEKIKVEVLEVVSDDNLGVADSFARNEFVQADGGDVIMVEPAQAFVFAKVVLGGGKNGGTAQTVGGVTSGADVEEGKEES